MRPTLNTLEIVTDRDTYVAGDEVTGTMFINVLHPFRCSALNIQVIGHEKSRLLIGQTNRFTSNTFLDAKTDIKEHDSPMKVGQYAFPFSFQLPANIPPSFKLESFGSMCEVSYRVNAHCRFRRLFKSTITASKLIQVNLAAPAPQQPIGLEVAQTINSFFLWKPSGDAKVVLNTDKNFYHPGEECQIFTTITNQSSARISEIRVRVTKTTTIRTTGFINSFSRKLQQQLLSVTRAVDLSANQTTQFPVSITIPTDAEQTSQSKLVDCQYMVVIEAVTPSITASNVIVKYPIIVAAAPVSEKAQSQTPCYSTSQQSSSATTASASASACASMTASSSSAAAAPLPPYTFSSVAPINIIPAPAPVPPNAYLTVPPPPYSLADSMPVADVKC